MKVAFWSEEDGCGTTSGMAAVASVCADAWNLKTILLQSRNQEGDLQKKLEKAAFSGMVREESAYYALDGLDYLLWQEKNKRLSKEVIKESLVEVSKDRLYYMPQGERKKPQVYPEEVTEAMCEIIAQTEQMADITFIDCGNGEDELSAHLIETADAVVVNFSQERQGLDAYFLDHHTYHGKVIYLIHQYQQESIYNKRNLSRIYRFGKEELGVIPHNSFFRHASDSGQVERFVYRQLHGNAFEHHHYFMEELMQSALLILKGVGLAA